MNATGLQRLAVLVAAGALVAGCGSTSPLAASSTTVTSTTTSTVPPTTAAPTTSTTVPKPKPARQIERRHPVRASIYDGLATIPPASLAAAAHQLTAGGSAPVSIRERGAKSDGKPVVTSIGAEWCSYCAAENWSLVVALAQFGTFKNLSWVTSSPKATEPYRSIPGFTFYKATYTSKELSFRSVELADVAEHGLQTETPGQRRLIRRFDRDGAIPFVYLDGRAYIEGSGTSPEMLVHRTFGAAARGVIGGKSKLARSVDGEAGVVVSYLCRLTNGHPGRVCRSFPAALTR